MWTRDELQNGILIFRNIQTSCGSMLSVYLGPGGAFAHMAHSDDPALVCITLKDILRITRLQLYLDDLGLYDPSSASFSDPVLPESIESLALGFVDGSDTWLGYGSKELERMGERLIFADAHERGWYRSAEGKEYLLRGNAFQELSEIDSNALYYLTLFGGSLGLHRFYMGKNLTGFLYLITGGLVMLGWAIDLIFQLLGCQRDKRNRLVRPLSQRLWKALLIPVGFCVNAAVLMAIRMMFSMILPV